MFLDDILLSVIRKNFVYNFQWHLYGDFPHIKTCFGFQVLLVLAALLAIAFFGGNNFIVVVAVVVVVVVNFEFVDFVAFAAGIKAAAVHHLLILFQQQLKFLLLFLIQI